MPEKLCANESIHPAHEWPSVPSYRCPGIGLTLRAEQAGVSAPRPPGEQPPVNMGRIMQEATRSIFDLDPERELSAALEREQQLIERLTELNAERAERDAQHSRQIAGLKKRIKNLKARVTTADEVLAHAARTADVTRFRDKYLREELRKRAELAEARTVEAQDQLDAALATLNKVREHALHMTTGKTGRPDKAHGRILLKILKGDRS